MSAGAAGDALHRGIFEGCISGRDMNIMRRPYHKNCKCALHKERGHCAYSSRHNNVSYPMRRTWSEGSCLSTTGAASPCHGDITRTHTLLVLYKDNQEVD